jgi:hypothetical protein
MASRDGDARSQQRRAGTGQSNQTTSNSSTLDSATVTGKYTPAQTTYATAQLLCDHLAWLIEEQEDAGLPVRQVVPLLARARLLTRDIAVVTEREGGTA